MQTIFITSFHSAISRNILMAGVPRLLAPDAEVVILVPREKLPYFKQEFEAPHIRIEPVDATLTRRDLFLRSLILAVTHTKGLTIKKRSRYFAERRLTAFLLSMLPSLLLRGARPVLAVVRFFDPLFLRSNRFASLLDTHRPALVFCTDLQNEMDVRLLEEAKRRGIKTVGMVRSWDNISAKGLLRAIPQTVVVHNDMLRRQVVDLNYVPQGRVEVIGIPHYDRYFDPKPTPREQFFASLGLDPSRKLIIFGPVGDRFVPDNKLDALILDTLCDFDANVLVRLPPGDVVEYLPLPQRKAKVVVQTTGTRPWNPVDGPGAAKINEISKSDDQTLIDSLYWADAVVTGQSTIALDAAVFDTPAVVAIFDQEPRPYWNSVRRYYDFEYYVPVLESGGVFPAYSPEELRELTAACLADPQRGEEGRRRLTLEQAQYTDGKSTERLAALLTRCMR